MNGVISTPVQIGVGDGATSTFELVPNPGEEIAQVWRNDWQGNQLLYQTPRTNQFIYSQNFSVSSTGAWQRSQLNVPFDNTVTALDGSMGAYLLTTSTSNAAHYMDQHVTYAPGGATTRYGIFKAGAMNIIEVRAYGNPTTAYAGVRVDLNTGQYNITGTGSNQQTFSVTASGNGWYKISHPCSFAADTATDHIFRTLLWNGTLAAPVQTFAGDGVSGLYCWAQQCEIGGSAGAYIPTVASQVTTTDYTVDPTGSVTLATPPVLNAILTWAGSYVYTPVALSSNLPLNTVISQYANSPTLL